MTGGFNGNYLSSTEVLTLSEDTWKYSTSLPFARRGLAGISVNNKVIMTGTRNC